MEEPSVTQSAGPISEMWEMHRPTIKRLYLDEDKTLPQLMKIMEEVYNFKGSMKMYKRRLTQWKMDGKNLKRNDVKQIARRKVERDAVGKPSRFTINDRDVDMDNLQRYLKKRGFSSLEEFAQAASPVANNSGVLCITPAHSPVSPMMDRNIVETQEVPRIHGTGSAWCDPFPLLEVSNIEQEPKSVRRRSSSPRFLSLSPEMTSRALLSLSPTPRTLKPPTALLLPEQMMRVLRNYIKGSFQANLWETGADGYLWCKNMSDPGDHLDWSGECQTAGRFIKMKDYVRARQVLSLTCRKMESGVNFESPEIITHLILATESLHKNRLPEMAAVISGHAHRLANRRLGRHHPVVRICGMLLKLGAVGDELTARLLQCQAKYLGQDLGLLHLTTIEILRLQIGVLDASEAVDRSRALLAACERTSPEDKTSRLRCMQMLGWALFNKKLYEDAEEVARQILAIVSVPSKIPYDTSTITIHALDLRHQILGMKGDFIKAEYWARNTVLRAIDIWGKGDTITMKYMVTHAQLLRFLGRNGEAERVEVYIHDMLGSPEIIELLD